MTHTEIEFAEIDGEFGTKWSDILRSMMIKLIRDNTPMYEIINISKLNILQGKQTIKGFHFIPQINYSLQNVGGDKAVKAIMALAKKYDKKVHIRVRWKAKPNAAHPNRYCLITN
ncbi:MAG: hypothetical protein AB8B69_05850 [Chitinophagales bacterium]